MKFNAHRYAYPSRRNVVYAKKAMVHSSMPLASQLGLDIMKRGGNAIDAAVAMAAALPLLEPTGNGIGGDCFALVWSKGSLYGLNGSGVAPMALHAGVARAAGCTTALPLTGWLPTMVPGAPAAWEMLRGRFGTLPMRELMEPAIRYAREGYPVAVTIAEQWEAEARRIGAAAKDAPQLYRPWMDTFSKGGAAYRAGELFCCGEYAGTLEELAATGCESLYRGELMRRIVQFSQETGGYFAESDFTGYAAEWVQPICIHYKGYDVYEMPPNGHGITALMALNILKGMELGQHREAAEDYHKLIEAVKLAFVDVKKYVADPRSMQTKVADMLSDKYAAARRALITDAAIYPEAGNPACGGTVYFCTADEEGNMVSFVQSNYTRFGSGIVIPGTGISLQNRGANFSLDPNSDNFLEGGKRAYHTIIPGFLAKGGRPVGPFGVMGAFMQPQGHVQVVVNTVDYHMNPQECLDAPRFQWCGEKKVQLEREVPAHIAQALEARGHQIEIVSSNISMGRGGMIWRMEDGTLAGGTEPRCDGSIAAW